jgi:hypothetical protein
MVKMNILIVLATAVIPMILGFIWYNPKVFGNAWMKASDMTEEKIKSSNMALILIVTFVFGFLLAFILQTIVIHQFSLLGILANEPGIMDPTSENGKWLVDFMAKHGNNFRTFKHGALHGTMAGLLIALPIVGINALFERRGFKYIAINTGYWTICLALMGGTLCAFV